MPRRARPAPAPAPVTGPFRLGAMPGATPGRWIDTWRERYPSASVDLVPLATRDAHGALEGHDVDAALVRLPLDAGGLSVIPLYEELPVAMFPLDSHLGAADELTLSDLAGETVLVPDDGVIGAIVLGADAPGFDPPATTEEAIEVVAAGIGVVLVPMSLARLHHRRDVDHRIVRDGPISQVALAWPTARTTPEVEAFVGIVRGRTANSSR